jgi:hypothetical protein
MDAVPMFGLSETQLGDFPISQICSYDLLILDSLEFISCIAKCMGKSNIKYFRVAYVHGGSLHSY